MTAASLAVAIAVGWCQTGWAQEADEEVELDSAGAGANATPVGAEISRVARAEEHAEAGYAAYARGEYTLAAAEYLRALEAAPSADIVYNLARIYDTKLRDRRRAAEYYRRYTQEPGADSERLHIAAERLLALREQDQIVAQGTTAPGQSAEAPAAATSKRAQDDAHVHGLSGAQTAGIVIGAIGVAGLATGLGFGIAAKLDADLAHRTCDGNACTTQRGVDAAQRGTSMAMVSTIALSTGGALLLVGAGLVLLGGGRSEHAQAEQAQRTQLTQITPWAGPTGLGVQLASAF